MHKLTIIILLLFSVGCFLGIANAKEAVPMAKDPELEKKVNDISYELRCLVCQNQTIADSHAPLAVDLKNQVREMVKNGASRDEVVDYMVERYGDFVRYRPPVKPTTYLLWVGPFILMVVGLYLLTFNLRKRKKVVKNVPLNDDEHAKLKSILNEDSPSSGSSTGEAR